MLALATTPRFLLLVDLDRRSVVPLESDRPEYYGVSWRPGSRDLALSHSGLDHESLVDLAAYAVSEVGWISVGPSDSPPCLSAPHQILVGSDGRVICTNTGRNCVTVIDPARPGHVQEARLGESRWDRLSAADRGGLHLNSVFEKDGLLHVLAHGFEHGSSLASFRYPSMDRVSFDPLPGLMGLHNYCITERGERISCDSNAGTLVDPHAGKVHWRSGTPGYLRGLAVGPSEIVVGDSPKLGRHLRASAVSGLWVIDRDRWTARDYLVLGPYGTVNEVRLLDVPDEAHHGEPFAGLDELLRRDVRRDASSRKLAAAERMRSAGDSLPFERIMGSPEIDADGRWSSSGDLCLLATRSASVDGFSIGYDLRRFDPSAHCGIVIGYDGPAGTAALGAALDTHMDVILVNRGARTGRPTVSHWVHDGAEWRQIETLLREAPDAGGLRVRRDGPDIVVEVDGRPAVRRPIERFPRIASRWGCRWQSTAVLPDVP